ncbi:MAG: DNA methyltransferase [Chromatiales bacterium]|nr:DNA methyltransferase [Chromatiales bacterium]
MPETTALDSEYLKTNYPCYSQESRKFSMQSRSRSKYRDFSWDFRTADTKADTHCYHNYPAMMIPQVAERLIARYASNAKTLFDPYCGTGTSLVEANLKSINAYGTDLNPLARLIARAKTTRIKLQVLDLYLKEFQEFLFALNFELKNFSVTLPEFHNIDFWFKPQTKEKLAIVKGFIDAIEDKNVQEFFLIAFSETVRESSLTRNGEFKLYRMSKIKREKFNPDVCSIMTAKLSRNHKGLQSYLLKTKNISATTNIYDFNSARDISAIEKDSMDIVVTSPPYGDSKTTVAYGQFSRLANQWLGISDANQVDNQLMGGKIKEIGKTGIGIVDSIVEKIARQDLKRAQAVYSFYDDYIKSIANVVGVVKRGAYICYVVGNRRVKDIKLPTDEITKSVFEHHGVEYQNTFIRAIPNKRMPGRNSPTNKAGSISATMTNEYIVVMQKH